MDIKIHAVSKHMKQVQKVGMTGCILQTVLSTFVGIDDLSVVGGVLGKAQIGLNYNLCAPI